MNIEHTRTYLVREAPPQPRPLPLQLTGRIIISAIGRLRLRRPLVPIRPLFLLRLLVEQQGGSGRLLLLLLVSLPGAPHCPCLYCSSAAVHSRWMDRSR